MTSERAIVISRSILKWYVDPIYDSSFLVLAAFIWWSMMDAATLAHLRIVVLVCAIDRSVPNVE